MFVNSRIWYSEPAAPCDAPALTDRSRVAQPGVPVPLPVPPVAVAVAEGEADAPPGDEGAVVCDVTACGVCDADVAPEGAADDAVAPVDPAVVAGVGDDPVDAVQ